MFCALNKITSSSSSPSATLSLSPQPEKKKEGSADICESLIIVNECGSLFFFKVDCVSV